MKINKITLNNFRQYKGTNVIDIAPSESKNIILIGGKNGYGKTNFLLALVWCLYGEDIAKIDDNFKKEIQKDGNYTKFLKSSLNWNSAKEGTTSYSVQIFVDGIELPELENQERSSRCRISRKCDASSVKEEFDIYIGDSKEPFPFSNEDKINFINDYIIPIEAAKFVFFDAEKIASWAELSTKEEGSVLNDALGKILGLDIYESLKEDLNIYTDSLRKESATAQVKQQIITTESGAQINGEKIDELEKEIITKETDIIKTKEDIVKYETFIKRYSKHNGTPLNIEALYSKRDELVKEEKDLEIKFIELSDILPFIISAGKLEEVIEHIERQNAEKETKEHASDYALKSDEVIERLFNNPPYPADGDIPFSKKMFYADKAKKILASFLGVSSGASKFDLNFEHDLKKSDEELIVNTFHFVRKQSKDLIEYTINSFNSIKYTIAEIEAQIKRIESSQEDEEIIEYANKKAEAERKLEKLIEEKGMIINKRDIIRRDIERLNQSLHILLKKISVSEKKRKSLEKANLYIKSIEDFITEQKKSKCSQLEDAIYSEMKRLMHKLNDGINQNFIAEVKVEILPENDGLKATLYNNDGQIVAKESLSQGEKQIYISSLIKAILSMSVQEFPIFIDTPLGRLDDDHIKRILLFYYPDLASQVVLMATNNEIPPSRYKLMKENIAQTYLLESKDNTTVFKPGYFNSYEN